MAAAKFRVLTDEENALLNMLGIGLDGKIVRFAGQDKLVLKHHVTSAEIYISTAGCPDKYRIRKDDTDGC